MDQAPVDVKQLCARLNALADELGRKVLLMGDGAVSYRSLIEENLTAVHSYAPAHLNEQKAGSVAARAMDLVRIYGEEKMESAAQHRPVYLRVSQAERVRAEKKAKWEKARMKKGCLARRLGKSPEKPDFSYPPHEPAGSSRGT